MQSRSLWKLHLPAPTLIMTTGLWTFFFLSFFLISLSLSLSLSLFLSLFISFFFVFFACQVVTGRIQTMGHVGQHHDRVVRLAGQRVLAILPYYIAIYYFYIWYIQGLYSL